MIGTLDRFEEQPLEHAPDDAPRSRQAAKLNDQKCEQSFEYFRQTPEEFGFERQALSPVLVHDHLEFEFDGEYALVHIRWIFHEAGLT